jgi:hypothetical protein
MAKALTSILEVKMLCTKCHTMSRLGDCQPCVAKDGSEGTGFGCPVPDCGGVMVEIAETA